MSIGQGKTISIVGAGVAGLSAACALARLGYRINMYEQSLDPRGVGGVQAGSVVLTARMMRALDALGAGDAVRAAGVEIGKQVLHGPPPVRSGARRRSGQTMALAMGGVAIPRQELRRVLLDAGAMFDQVEVFFGQRCAEADAQAGTLRLVDERARADAGGGSIGDGFVASTLIIGADGAQSVVRRAMQLTPGFSFTQGYGACAIRRFVIGAAGGAEPGGENDVLDRGAAHVWAHGGVVVTALPRPDGRLDCTVHAPVRGPDDAEQVRSRAAAESLLRRHAPELLEVDAGAPDALAEAPAEHVMTTRCAPGTHATSAGAGLVLVGDAAHAAQPLLGLDCGAAIEDAVALATALDRAGGDVSAALSMHQRERCPEAVGGSETLNVILESLRSRSDSRLARARSVLERALSDMLPSLLAPRAGALAASTAPLEQTRRRADRLDRVLRGIGVAGLIVVLFVLVLLRVPQWPLLVGVVVGGWAIFEIAAHSRPVRSVV